jgi:hypothetical protein
MITMSWKFRSLVLASSLTILNLLFGLLLVPVTAQSTANPINLGITTVEVDGVNQSTRRIDILNWQYDGQLDKNDAVKFIWEGIDLNRKYLEAPARGGGYLRLYNGSVSDETFVTHLGTDNYPLQLDTLDEQLESGPNTLVFVYENSLTKATSSPINFRFNYIKEVDQPELEVVKPQAGAVFMEGVEQEIELIVSNFFLSPNPSSQPDVGKVFLYANEVSANTFLGKITNGTNIGDNRIQVTLSSSDFTFDTIPDSEETNLIFLLTDSNENPIDIQSSVQIKTNYGDSLDLGLPRVRIVEPQKNRSDLSVAGDTRFILQVDNFEILTETPSRETNNGPLNLNRGYLQISIFSGDRGEPIQPRWGATEFTLNEIGYQDDSEGQKTLRVQLVNENFEVLKPEANDSITIFYSPAVETDGGSEVQVESNIWRIVFISLTVILVVGGISVLITKG